MLKKLTDIEWEYTDKMRIKEKDTTTRNSDDNLTHE